MKKSLISLAAALFLSINSAVFAARLAVERVVDGDTLALSDGRKVRLIGVDTPESRASAKLNRDARREKKDRETIKALGRRATAFTKRLVEGEEVELRFDQANAARKNLDRYGRTLAYVYVKTDRTAAWVDKDVRESEVYRNGLVNGIIIFAGYGRAYTSHPFSMKDDFLRYDRSAREANRGLWKEDAPARKRPALSQIETEE